MPTQDYEQVYWKRNQLVAGVDEAGRGALAGPVFAAAVILYPYAQPLQVNDSKMLTPEQRSVAQNQIQHSVLAYSIASASVEEIEQLNILQATFLAMHRAISALNTPPQHLLIDGNRFKPLTIPHSCIVKGDAQSESIAAASILAKTARDSYMSEVVHGAYPRYNFEAHKGYGTAEHRRAIQEWGPTEVHRSLFLRKILSTPRFLP